MNQAAMQDFGKLVLRVVLGALILLHGISKLKNGLGPIEGMVVAHGLPGFVAYGALVGEVLAPLMLLFGFYARIGAVAHRHQHAVRVRDGAHGATRPAQRTGRLGAGTAGHVPVHRRRDRVAWAGALRDQPR